MKKRFLGSLCGFAAVLALSSAPALAAGGVCYSKKDSTKTDAADKKACEAASGTWHDKDHCVKDNKIHEKIKKKKDCQSAGGQWVDPDGDND